MIKIRAKQIGTTDWVYGFPSFDGLKPMIYSDGDLVEIIPETAGQFTGMLDENSKEIYEGDIVDCIQNISLYDFKTQTFVNDEIFSSAFGPVSYSQKDAAFVVSDKAYLSVYQEIRIFGNIYDRPNTQLTNEQIKKEN